MARRTKKEKPLIYIFCEGESEQAYVEFLRKKFSCCAVLKSYGPFPTNLFQEAKSQFEKNSSLYNNTEITDEVWFFFDVDNPDSEKWDRSLKIIKHIRRLRRRPGIKVRLLMTTACIEYWFLLHYEFFSPSLCTEADKNKLLKKLQTIVPTYQKGAKSPTFEIAGNYKTAIQNGKHTLERLLQDGLPLLEATDDRNRWLYLSTQTFTTVQEAIAQLEFLFELSKTTS